MSGERMQTAGRLAASSVVLAVATGLAQATSFVFNAVGARSLGPAAYGTLAATVGLFLLLSPVLMAVQTITCRETTAVLEQHGLASLRRVARSYTIVTFGIGLAAAVAGGLASRAAARYLHLTTALPLLVLAVGLPIATMLHAQRGVLQGARKFGALSGSIAGEAAVKTTLVVGLLLALAWRHPSAGAAAIVAGWVAGWACSAAALRRLPTSTVCVRARSRTQGFSVVAMLTMGMLSILLSIDTLAAKRYLPVHTAGLYVGLALAGKIAFYCTSAVATVAFPLLSASYDRGGGGRRQIMLFTGAALAVCGVVVGALFAIPRVVVRLLLGHHYLGVAGYAGWAALVFTLYAIVYVMATVLMAHRKPIVVVWLAADTAAMCLGLYTWHGSIPTILRVLAAVFGGSATSGVALAIATTRSGRLASAIHLDGESLPVRAAESLAQ